MTSLTASSVNIQTISQAVPSTPSWFGEVAAFAQVLSHTEILKKILNHPEGVILKCKSQNQKRPISLCANK